MSTLSPHGTSAAASFDLLEHVAVSVPCGTCGQHYNVTLRHVLLAHEMLHEGCPVHSDTECPPLTYAALADESSLRDLERSWTRVAEQARAAGGTLSPCVTTITH